jgi:hypothetical protein
VFPESAVPTGEWPCQTSSPEMMETWKNPTSKCLRPPDEPRWRTLSSRQVEGKLSGGQTPHPTQFSKPRSACCAEVSVSDWRGPR